MAASEQNHSHLSTLLSDAGLDVVLQEVAGEDFIKRLEQTSADVLLVDLGDDAGGSEVDIIDTLLEYDSLPVFFNDSSKAGSDTDALWAKKLARRLQQLVSEFEPEPVLENDSGLAFEPEADQLVTADQTSELGMELEPSFELEANAAALQESEFSLEEVPEEKPKFESNDGLAIVTEPESDSGLELETDLTLEPVSSPESENVTELELAPDLEDQASHDQSGPTLDAESFSNIEEEISEEIESLPQQSDSAMVALKEDSSVSDLPEGAAVNVWVLGASLGGPQAVRQFLMAIRKDLPVAFVLAQHIGENHISLLAEQLDRVSKFKVFPGYSGHMIRHHEVILAPAGKNIHITDDGYISLSDQEENAIYSPCINDVMTAVARRYGDMAGTIVFSGMGDDGAIGCQSVADNGGIVWAQDVDSCVISSMPDQARKTNNVTFSANPRRLADELYKYYMQ